MNIPDILTANTYFWTPSGSASGRRSNEKRRNEEAARFISENREVLDAHGIEIHFDYNESCKNVYKTCKITRNGKRSNIIAVRKALEIGMPSVTPVARTITGTRRVRLTLTAGAAS